MSRNHARNNARRAAQQATGCNHRHAVQALRNRTSLQRLVDDGARARDLAECLGLTPHQAQQALRRTAARTLTATAHRAVPIGAPGLAPIIAIVPAGELALRYLDQYGLYLRDEALLGRIRLRASHLGYVRDDVLTVHPIVRRHRVGSAAALPRLLGRAHPALAEPDLHTCWSAPATLLQIGPALPAQLQADTIVRGVQYTLTDDFQHGARTGTPLASLPHP